MEQLIADLETWFADKQAECRRATLRLVRPRGRP
jgi:hypothetical protein